MLLLVLLLQLMLSHGLCLFSTLLSRCLERRSLFPLDFITNEPAAIRGHQNWDLNLKMHSQEDKLLDLRDSRTWCT